MVGVATSEQKLYCRKYIRRSLAAMELGHWRVAVHFGDVKDAVAKVDGPECQNVATIKIDESFWKLPKLEKRQTIAHELIHLAMAPIDDAASAVLSDDARKILGTVSERITDALAWPLARVLPEWGE